MNTFCQSKPNEMLMSAPTRQGNGAISHLIPEGEVIVFDIMGDPCTSVELDRLLKKAGEANIVVGDIAQP